MSVDTERRRGMRRVPSGRSLRALVAVLAMAVAGGACTPFDDAMVAIFGRSMRDQRSFDPYENPRLPAENAVPFASGNYPAGVGDVGLGQAEPTDYAPPPPFTPGDMAPPGSAAVRDLENPVPATEESLARGQVVYDRFCAVCHGSAGLSAEAPIIDRMPVMGAWNLATGNPTGYSDGYMYGMVRAGRGAMPAYGHRITHFDRWHVVNYVRRLQEQASGDAPAEEPAGPVDEAPDTAASSGASGAADTAGSGGEG